MTYRNDLNLISDALESYQTNCLSRDSAVLQQMPISQLADKLHLNEYIKQGGLNGDTLVEFLNTYLDNTSRLLHPAHMGHQTAVPHPSSVLGALVDAFTNNPMAIYEMGPSAATIEFTLINWMLEKVGWNPAPFPGEICAEESFGGGVLTHGGSLAQLTALAAARSQANPNIWENGNSGDLVVISSPEAHYSVARAIGILGLGQNALIACPSDNHGRMIPEKLEETISACRNDGKKIMAVIAMAGCTSAGLYDDLKAIGETCQKHKVWFHVDGAHGASAILSNQYRHLLDGIELATSLIWDAHKMMRTPGLCAAVLFKDHNHIDNAFCQEASYIFHDKEQAGVDTITRAIECTKAGLGLKFFMGLAAEGEKGLGGYIENCYTLARQVSDLITDSTIFELAIKPQANIVCFRIKGESDDMQLQLRNMLIATGRSYITTTKFANQRWLRFTLMNPATTIADVQETLEILEKDLIPK